MITQTRFAINKEAGTGEKIVMISGGTLSLCGVVFIVARTIGLVLVPFVSSIPPLCDFKVARQLSVGDEDG